MVPGGHHDDRQLGERVPLSQEAEHFQAVQLRHHDVQEDHVEFLPIDQLSAWRPSLAAVTAYPFNSSRWDSMSRFISSSSTINKRTRPGVHEFALRISSVSIFDKSRGKSMGLLS